MASYGTTAKYALRKLLGASLVSEVDAGFEALADDIDGKMVGYSSGPLASRPVSTGGSPGIAGRRYRATDTGILYEDTGTGWVEIAVVPVVYSKIDTAAKQTLLGYWRTLAEANCSADSAIAGGGDSSGIHALGFGGSIVKEGTGAPNAHGAALVQIAASDLSVSGLTTKLRYRASCLTNGTSPVADLQFGLYPVVPVGIPGTHMDLGTVVAGSTVTLSPGASAALTGVSSEINLPGDGLYCLGVSLSSSIDAGSHVFIRGALQARHV